MASQFSLVGGIQSGAGALGRYGSTDQTGNLLGISGIIVTPNVMINKHNNPGGVKKKRFGVVTPMGGKVFDYPTHPVKTAAGENGQAYPQSKSGYLPGNNGGGQAGFGIDREWHEPGVSADLMMAKSIAQKEAGLFAKFGGAEHIRTVDPASESLKEHFEEQAKEAERQKITHLMSMGFSEQEIAKKAEKDREKAIEQAQKMAPKMSDKTLGLLNTPTSDKFFNDSIAPGLVPAKKDASSYERAIAAGNPVAQKKAKQAMRMREQMGKIMDRQDTVHAKVPMKHSEIFQQMMAISKKEMEVLQQEPLKQEEKLIQHQKMKDDLVNKKLQKMGEAMKR